MTTRRVPAVGPRRRLQALAWLGWTTSSLAALTAIPTRTINRILTGKLESVPAEQAQTIAALFNTTWDHPPTSESAEEERAQQAQRARARTAGWAPALAWDEIDDPEDTPQGVREDEPPEATVLELVWLLRIGTSPHEVARRLGVQPASLARRLRRYGHHSWAALCERRPLR